MIRMIFLELPSTRRLSCILTQFLYTNKRSFNHVFTPASMMVRLGVIPSNLQSFHVFLKTVLRGLRGTASRALSTLSEHFSYVPTTPLLFAGDRWVYSGAFEKNSSSILPSCEEPFFHKIKSLYSIKLIPSTIWLPLLFFRKQPV